MPPSIHSKIRDVIATIFIFFEGCNIKFHGPLLEHLVTGDEIKYKTLFAYIPMINEDRALSLFSSQLLQLDSIFEKYTCIPLSLHSNGSNILATCFEFVVCIENDVTINIIFHNSYISDILFVNDNICLTKKGLSVYQSSLVPIANEQVFVLSAIESIVTKKTKLISQLDTEYISNNSHSIFHLVFAQNKQLRRGFTVTGGLSNPMSTDITIEFCGICYRKSSTVFLYELVCGHIFCFECIDTHSCCSDNKTCPICRGVLEFKIIS